MNGAKDVGNQEASPAVEVMLDSPIPADNGWHRDGLAIGEATADAQGSPMAIDPKDLEVGVIASLKTAQELLQHRQEAQTQSDRSLTVLAQSESILEEAIRSVEAVGKAYGDGFTADSPAKTEAMDQAREMADTLKARLKKNRSEHQDLVERGSVAKAYGIQDLAAALDAVNAGATNVERALRESVRASSMADAAKEQAMEDLAAVHTMWDGLTLRPQERPAPQTLSPLPAEQSEGQAVTTPVDPMASSTVSEPSAEASEPAHRTTVQLAGSGAALRDAYTGRLYLMFEASLTREGLESVWDAVEEASSSGVIVDTRLVSQADGVQVTLELNEAALDVEAFLRRLPGSSLVPLAGDRLKVAWPAAGVN